MEAHYVAHLQKLGWPYLIVTMSILALVAISVGTFIYFGVLAAREAWNQRKFEQLRRDEWFAEQDRIHRESTAGRTPTRTAIAQPRETATAHQRN